MFSVHEGSRLEAAFRARKVDPHRLRRLRTAFYQKALTRHEALLEVPAEHREAIAGLADFHALTLEARHDSAVDGASKLVFRTRAGLALESVILRPRTGRTSLCVSSQVGCAARCVFCATGYMGVVRDLAADEILDQVIQANQILKPEGRRVRNVVFMGMGEPFHNEASVHAALGVLLADGGFGLSARRVSVSTVGVPQAIVRCARKFPGLGLALSLHSAREEVRKRIVPLAKVHGLAELRRALAAVTGLGSPVMIEYLLLDAVNDGPEDRRALIEYLRGLTVHVNLIPYNPIDAAPGLRGTPEPRRKAFADELKAEGFKVTLRYSQGADIAAACGQLARRGVG